MKSELKNYQGSCHCGAIKFEFSAPLISSAMRCNCSICERKGALLSADVITPELIAITDSGNTMQTYQFGTMTARHHFCKRCGIHTFVETRLNPGHYRINLGCVHEVETPSLTIQHFNGKQL